MKLRNKKTGEIGYSTNYGTTYYVTVNKNNEYICKDDLFDEWEECEDKETFWFIAYDGKLHKDFDDESDWIKELKVIGNYFKTRESAEKAMEKLKAWKRLKDKRFRFECWYGGSKDISFSIPQEIIDKATAKDLDLLFGGEE